MVGILTTAFPTCFWFETENEAVTKTEQKMKQ